MESALGLNEEPIRGTPGLDLSAEGRGRLQAGTEMRVKLQRIKFPPLPPQKKKETKKRGRELTRHTTAYVMLLWDIIATLRRMPRILLR